MTAGLGSVCAGYMGAGPHRGGGMHVGPGDPIFGPGRMGGGVGGPPGHGSLPPGARWDPVAPPGLPGFNPGAQPGGGGMLVFWQRRSSGQCRLIALLACSPPSAAVWRCRLLADDFQHPPGGQPRPPPPVHPDVMQPGAGGNSGWGDQMFG